jgi:hypothetical protein
MLCRFGRLGRMLATIIARFSVDAFANMALSSLLATIALMYFCLQACLARVVRGSFSFRPFSLF